MEKVAIINNIARIITESSTSSDDSDSEVEEILRILIKNRTSNIPRMRKKYMDVVSQYTDKEFKSHFRYIFIIFV